MQSESGDDTQFALSHEDHEALLAEFFPTPDPELHRTSAKNIMVAVKGIDMDKSLPEDRRLQSLHQMLELCAIELERETQEYQAAHRRLVGHEGDYLRMVATQSVPEDVFRAWENQIEEDMDTDLLQMRRSRENAKALLNTLGHVEHQGDS